MADPGKGAGGADAPLFLDQTEQPRPQGAFPWLWGRGAHMAEKNLLETGTPSPLIPELDDPPPPPSPYLKVWIRHCHPGGNLVH